MTLPVAPVSQSADTSQVLGGGTGVRAGSNATLTLTFVRILLARPGVLVVKARKCWPGLGTYSAPAKVIEDATVTV